MATGVKPNILIVGTPGTGKTTISSELAQKINFNHVNIGDVVKENSFYDSYDEVRKCHIIDEDQIIDFLESKMCEGGNIVEYHGGDFFPERWFQFVFVLRTDNQILYKRLAERGYDPEKIKENIECEIFQVISDEISEAYASDIVHELHNNTMEDFLSNISKIESIVSQSLMDI